MSTLFGKIHIKMTNAHNKAVELGSNDEDYENLMGKAQAYADILDLLEDEFKDIKDFQTNQI